MEALYIMCWFVYAFLAYSYARANQVISRDQELVYELAIQKINNGCTSPNQILLSSSMIISYLLFQQWPLFVTPWFIYDWPIALGFTIFPLIYNFGVGFIEYRLIRSGFYDWLFVNMSYVWASFLAGFSLLAITYVLVS